MPEKDVRGFKGFFKETLYFFKELEKNNNKPWFDQNRELYEEYVLSPSKSFVISMGEKLKELTPMVNADPRTNKSLFRINRDTRFSKDKSPYKTHMGILFWEGNQSRMESPAYYFHLESDSLMLGAGIYKFTREQLEEYRESVIDKKRGPKLKNIYEDLSGKGFGFGGKNYKRLPKGFDSEAENSDLLMHDGLFVSKKYVIPKEFYTGDLIDFCFKPYSEMQPLQKWLAGILT